MQSLTEIRRILADFELSPRKQFSQCFLIDKNLMAKVLEMAEIPPDACVLEVGPGTGSLTEELLARAAKVVAVEIDRGLSKVLADKFGSEAQAGRFKLICSDVLASKHRISPEVLAELGGKAHMVANLPYNIATPLVVECLLESWRACRGLSAGACMIERMTFTVQQEMAQRLGAACGSDAYGPVSVITALLGRVRLGASLPAAAFWPVPNVTSRIVRIDFDPAKARALADAEVLSELLAVCFQQRRKQIGAIMRKKQDRFAPGAMASAIASAGIEPSTRPERITPGQYLTVANLLTGVQ